jgi:hypothetical protein
MNCCLQEKTATRKMHLRTMWLIEENEEEEEKKRKP